MERQDIIDHARRYIGTPYEVMVCTDLIVTAADLKDDMIEFATNHLHYFSQVNRRLSPQMQIVQRFIDGTGLAGILRKGPFNNTPENPDFPRRLQNLIDYQQALAAYLPHTYFIPKEGWVAYFMNGKCACPSHVGLITEVKEGKPDKVIHSSSSRGVIEDPMGLLLEHLSLCAYGILVD